MKRYIVWIIVIIILLGYLFIRWVGSIYRPKLPLKNKDVLQIEYVDKNKKNVTVKKENNQWVVITQNAKYKADIEKCKSLIEKLAKFELLEIVSRKVDSYNDYNLTEDTAVKVKILLKQRPYNMVIWLGKTGGFTYEEVYARINNKPEVYLTRNLSTYEFKNNFYDLCDRTILQSTAEDVNRIDIKSTVKNLNLKKELKDATTVWLNLKTAKQVDNSKIDNLLRFTTELTSDVIIEPQECDLSKLKTLSELKLYFVDGTEIILNFYDKINIGTEPVITVYPVRVKCTTVKGSSIKNIGEETNIYGIYEYRYQNFKDTLTSL